VAVVRVPAVRADLRRIEYGNADLAVRVFFCVLFVGA
jgi:hypothetical protein